MIEFLEKNYEAEYLSEEDCLKLACKALLDVVESGGKNVELVVLKQIEYNGKKTYEYRIVPDDQVEALIKEIEIK